MARTIHTVPTSSVGDLIGIQNVVKVPQPAAGSDWSYTMPGGYYYRMLSGSAVFTTSATVANRMCGLQLTDGQNLLGMIRNSANITASSVFTVTYSGSTVWSFGGPAGTTMSLNMPSMWLPPGYVLASTTMNIQTTDQYSAVVLFLEQLDYGALGEPEGRHAPTAVESVLTG